MYIEELIINLQGKVRHIEDLTPEHHFPIFQSSFKWDRYTRWITFRIKRFIIIIAVHYFYRLVREMNVHPGFYFTRLMYF